MPGNNVADAAPASGARVAAAAAAPPPPPDAESQAVVSALNGMLGALSETPLSPSEKKMLGDVTKVIRKGWGWGVVLFVCFVLVVFLLSAFLFAAGLVNLVRLELVWLWLGLMLQV